MKKVTLALVSITYLTSCSTISQPASSIKTEIDETNIVSASEISDLPNQLELPLSIDDLNDEIRGTSSDQKIIAQKVEANWQFGPYCRRSCQYSGYGNF